MAAQPTNKKNAARPIKRRSRDVGQEFTLRSVSRKESVPVGESFAGDSGHWAGRDSNAVSVDARRCSICFVVGIQSNTARGLGQLRGEFGGLGDGVEGGDGLDETGDGEGVEDAARGADQVERAAVTGERDGHANEGGDSRAVNMRDAVEVYEHFARAAFENGIER